MTELVVSALALVVLAAVLYPFLRPEGQAEGPGAPGGLEPLLERRQGLYQSMETLHLEREMGTVDEEEYQRRVGEYRRQAAESIRLQEALEVDDVEGEVRAARARLRRAAGRGRCGNCGAMVEPDTDICARCGASVRPQGAGTEGGAL